MSNKKGYTLVEIMAVVAIVMILSVLALSGLSDVVRNLRFSNTFNKIIFMVQQARSLAISGSNAAVTYYGVQFNTTTTQQITLFANKDATPVNYTSPPDELIENLEFIFIPNLVFNGTSSIPLTICTSMVIFFKNGTGDATLKCNDADSPNLQVGLKDTIKNKSRSFIINATGGILQVQ